MRVRLCVCARVFFLSIDGIQQMDFIAELQLYLQVLKVNEVSCHQPATTKCQATVSNTMTHDAEKLWHFSSPETRFQIVEEVQLAGPE